MSVAGKAAIVGVRHCVVQAGTSQLSVFELRDYTEAVSFEKISFKVQG